MLRPVALTGSIRPRRPAFDPAVTVGVGAGPAKFVAYFGDITASVHAVDVLTGQALWKTKVDDHPLARITGAVQIHDGRLFAPVADNRLPDRRAPAEFP